MGQTAFPEQADVEEYIDSLGLIDDDDLPEVLQKLRCDVKALAAKQAWERDTGWVPFLKDTADVTRYFEPQGSAVIDLGGGLLTLTSLVTGFSESYAGTSHDQDTEYWLEPANAGVDGQPWTKIRFAWRQWGLPRSVKIVGRWGYAATVPEDAWNAVLVKAAALCYPELSVQVNRGLVGVRTQATDVRYVQGAVTALSQEKKAWEQTYCQTVLSYHRMEL